MKLNFADTEAYGGFEAIPGGWYWAKVTDGSDTETKNAGKLPAGTPGINWEFTVQDGKYEGRKVWTNTWIAPQSIGFLKGLAKATDRFTDEDLNSGDLDSDELRAQMIGADIMIRVAKREYPADSGDHVNDVKGWKKWQEGQVSQPQEVAETSAAPGGSFLP